jgi:hypothetical protein
MKTAVTHSITLSEQTPIEFADQIGQQYAACVSENHKKRYGQYLTRPQAARFMRKTL